MKVSFYYLIDQFRVNELASTSFSFEMLCNRINQELDSYCREHKLDRGIEFVTVDPNFVSYAEPEEILWVFLLLNPEHAFRKNLCPEKESLLRNALALEPTEYASWTGYNYDLVAEKLHCSRMECIYITRYWEILPVYSDTERKTINLPYLIKKSGSAESAAELYSIYALCSEEEAEKVVQEYLSNGAEKLFVMYPGGNLAIRNNETVMKIKLYGENDKAAWLGIEHPFFRANSPMPEYSAELFFDYLSKSIYRYALYTAFGYQDHHIEYSGYLTTGYESKDKIVFIRSEQYSYHDAGGGSEDSLHILPLSKDKRKSLIVPKEMMTKEYYSERGIDMPPCQGYWEDGGILYLMNPFHMENVFILESSVESWD